MLPMVKAIFVLLGLSVIVKASAWAAETSPLLKRSAAFGCFRTDTPGVRRKITPTDLPPPFATESAENSPTIVPQPGGATLRLPSGFVVQKFATGLDDPRLVRVAPNGDIFIAESGSGRIGVM